jgi:hypothetical protein
VAPRLRALVPNKLFVFVPGNPRNVGNLADFAGREAEEKNRERWMLLEA